jgi:integrase
LNFNDLEKLKFVKNELSSVASSVDEYLVAKDFMEKTYDFKKARLVKSEGEKGWYIVFYVWDVQKNSLVRRRKYIPPTYKTNASKEAYAKDLIKKINLLLKEGYHIDRVKKMKETLSQEIEETRFLSIDEAVPRYINFCKNIAKNSEGEIEAKIIALSNFRRWIEQKRYMVFNIDDVTPVMARQYCDYLIEVKGNGSKTFNNTLGRIKHFFNIAKKRKWAANDNPFNDIERQPTEYGEKNIAYTNNQLQEIIPYIQETNPYLYNFICFIYYGLMRTTEIRRLRVGNIDLNKRLIRIYASQSKVKKYDILPISDALYSVIKSMEIEKYPSDYYLFSKEYKPSKVPLHEAWATQHFRKVKKHFNLNKNYSLYSFKHTAVCRWYEKEKDIVRIQRMCRHSSIEMTARYLKSLGLLTDQYKIETLPDL